VKTRDQKHQPFWARICACLPVAMGLALCSSCSTPPDQDDGLVGIIYHASVRHEVRSFAGSPEAEPQRQIIPPPVEIVKELPGKEPSTETGKTAAMPNATPAPKMPFEGPTNYRISPGDVLAVSYFPRPPGDSKEYLIDSQDVLTISVAGQQTFTGDVTVRPDGCISFFLIGEMNVRGLTVAQVRTDIATRMAKFMAGAEITVILKEGNALARDFLNTLRSNTDLGSTRIIQIRNDGTVTFPLVGEVSAMGKTLPALSAELDEKYNRVFRRGIAVALNLTSSSDGNIAVLGEVRNPGRYTINNPISPFFALAMAGGALDTAKKSEVVVVSRRTDGKVNWHVVNLDINSGKPLGPEIALSPQDMLLVPRTGVANLNTFVDQYIRRMMPVPTGLGFGYNLN